MTALGIDPGASLLALDPGPTQSALVLLDTRGLPTMAHVFDNETVRLMLKQAPVMCGAQVLVIEKVESFGMAVGASVFETVYWSGRFAEAWGGPVERIGRKAIKVQLCGTAKAKDANIRAALIDRFGGEAAIGRKSAPGPLYGIKSHAWAALAVGVAWAEGAR
jgi:hypothetical protein